MITSTSFYRLYRPQTFDEVIGQDVLVSLLKQQIQSGTFSHAYLFHGSRGIGKTTLARITSNALGVQGIDCFEIDGASYRRIDDVRSFQNDIMSLPMASPFKVYIIDEVHMFTKEAFNALLKTLEEPPKHVLFMLATTDVQKVPDTITSRCMMMPLATPRVSDISQVVVSVAQKQGFSLSQQGSEMIARLGKGSFRDALVLLQQVCAYIPSNDTEISDEIIQQSLGVVPTQLARTFLQAYATRNTSHMVELLEVLRDEHVKPSFFVDIAIEQVQHILRIRFSQGKAREDFLKSAQGDPQAYDFFDQYSGKDGTLLNSKLLKKLLDISLQQSRSSDSWVPVELAIYELLEDNTLAR